MKRLVVLVLLLTAACATAAGPSQASKDADVRTHQRVAVAAPVAASKVLVIVEENHSFAQMKKQMPYLWGLAQQYGYATNSHGNYHPSQPNYVVMAAGENKGITTNSLKQVKGPSVFGKTIAAGRTAKIYADAMGSDNCRQTGTNPYAYRHNNWISFKDERALCEKFDVDYKAFAPDVKAGTLPNVGFIIPSGQHNGHDASLAKADVFLKTALTAVFAGPDWKAGRLAIIVTADEDDKKSGQQILTAVIHPSQSHKIVTAYVDHVSLHMLLARFGHTTALGTAWKTHTDLGAAFGLPVS